MELQEFFSVKIFYLKLQYKLLIVILSIKKFVKILIRLSLWNIKFKIEIMRREKLSK
jgi:hypothetical protein